MKQDLKVREGKCAIRLRWKLVAGKIALLGPKFMHTNALSFYSTDLPKDILIRESTIEKDMASCVETNKTFTFSIDTKKLDINVNKSS